MKSVTLLLGSQHFSWNKGDDMNCEFCKQDVMDKEIFHSGKKAFAIPDTKPVVPGHVLVIPNRHVEKFTELTEEEIVDIFQVVKEVYDILIKAYKATAFNLVIQDGRDAGQSIAHLHLHISPRRKGDIDDKELYDKLLHDGDRPSISDEELEKIVNKLRAVRL